jgi:hypothetical protein
MDLKEIEWENKMYWVNLAKDADRRRTFVNAVMNIEIP